MNIEQLLDDASAGARIKLGDKVIWKGLGNRAGLYDYAATALAEKWAKSGARFEKKVRSLPSGTSLTVLEYVAIDRSRGRWIESYAVTT